MAKNRKTRKKQTAKQAIKRELQLQGLLPPPKKRLNRGKFIETAKETLFRNISDMRFTDALCWAIHEMLEKREYSAASIAGRHSAEAIGAAKCVLLAERRLEFEREHRGETITTGQLIEAVIEIYDA